MTKEDLVKLLKDANLWNEKAMTEQDRLDLILALANCAGDLACGLDDMKLSGSILDKTLNIAQYIGGDLL